MKKLGLFLLMSLLGASATLAGSIPTAGPILRVGFELSSFRSKPVNTITKLIVASLPTGEVQVTIDPNRCSLMPNGNWACTKIAIRSYPVEVKIVKNSLPVDGPLVLDLSNGLYLEISSGNTQDGIITYTGIFQPGTTSEERLDLTPNVYTSLMKTP